MGTLCAQLFLQFYADSFETSHVFWSWSEDVHVVWIYILSLFLQFELSLFSGIITINICRQYVPCEGNSSYKFYIFRWFLISLKNLGGDINSLNLLVYR